MGNKDQSDGVGVGTIIIFVGVILAAVIVAGTALNLMTGLMSQPDSFGANPQTQSNTDSTTESTESADETTSGNTKNIEDESLIVDSQILLLQLRSGETVVAQNESAIFTFSSSALIAANDPVNVQLILEPPSGVSVSSSEFTDSGGGQYTTTYKLKPGESKGIRVQLNANEPGDYEVTGRAIYYEGQNRSNSRIETVDIPVKVTSESNN